MTHPLRGNDFLKKTKFSVDKKNVKYLTWSLIPILFAAASAVQASAPAPTAPPISCTASREYITALEYLRAHSEFVIPEKVARDTALRVSRGCTGAAQRFIKVTGTLAHAGLQTGDAVRTGLDFAKRSDIESETFVAVFLQAFARDSLDLDLRTSVQLARSLSTEFRGDILAVRKDWESLVKFCITDQGLGLPLPQCAALATRIAQKGEPFSGGVSTSFVQAFQFLTSDKGPSLTTQQALQLAERLVGNGKEGIENFILAFKYGTSSQGLALTSRDAIEFARGMSLAAKSASEPTPASEMK